MASIRNGASKSSLFLIELIITIFFFSLAGVTCMRLFIYAHAVSEDSAEQTQAVRIAQNTAESFMAARGDAAVFEDFLQLWLKDAALTAVFDENWNCVELARGQLETDEHYAARLRLKNMTPRPGTASQLEVQVLGTDGHEIYVLQVEQYKTRGSKAALLALVGRGSAGGGGVCCYRRDPLLGAGGGARSLPHPGPGRVCAGGHAPLRGAGQRSHAHQRLLPVRHAADRRSGADAECKMRSAKCKMQNDGTGN